MAGLDDLLAEAFWEIALTVLVLFPGELLLWPLTLGRHRPDFTVALGDRDGLRILLPLMTGAAFWIAVGWLLLKLL